MNMNFLGAGKIYWKGVLFFFLKRSSYACIITAYFWKERVSREWGKNLFPLDIPFFLSKGFPVSIQKMVLEGVIPSIKES